MNFARLNHILIPSSKAGRDRLRRGLVGRLAWPILAFDRSLSLEGKAYFVLVMGVGAAGLDVGRSQVYLLWAALSGLLIGALVIRPFFALKNVQLSVHTAPRVVVGQPVRFDIQVHNRGTVDQQALRLNRPFLPWDGQWVGSPRGLAHLPAKRQGVLTTYAKFVQRGTHHLDTFSVSALAPLGLTVGPATRGVGPRFLVVPQPAKVMSIDLSIDPLNERGQRALVSRSAETQELLGVRPYRSGDPIRDLHARTWARIGQPFVKEYQEEVVPRTVVVLDATMENAPEVGLEAAISVAAGCVQHLVEGGNLVDLVVLDRDAELIQLCAGGADVSTTVSLDRALDRLAIVTPGRDDRSAASVVLAACNDAGRPTSSVLVIDVARRTALDAALGPVIARLKASGIPVRGVSVGPRRTVASKGFVLVDAEKVRDGSAVSC